MHIDGKSSAHYPEHDDAYTRPGRAADVLSLTAIRSQFTHAADSCCAIDDAETRHPPTPRPPLWPTRVQHERPPQHSVDAGFPGVHGSRFPGTPTPRSAQTSNAKSAAAVNPTPDSSRAVDDAHPDNGAHQVHNTGLLDDEAQCEQAISDTETEFHGYPSIPPSSAPVYDSSNGADDHDDDHDDGHDGSDNGGHGGDHSGDHAADQTESQRADLINPQTTAAASTPLEWNDVANDGCVCKDASASQRGP